MKDTKMCSKCKKEKELDSFYTINRKKTNKDGTVREWTTRQSQCKSCRRVINKKDYITYKKYHEEYRKKNKARQQRCSKEHYVSTNLEWVTFIGEHIELACSKCGYNDTWAGLDFHHTDPREKETTIHSIMKSGKKTPERAYSMEQELRKCVVLCATCHREEHMKYNWLKPDSIKL